MTSRTTPVGIIVLALTGLISVGCSAPTTAVFNALFDPAETPVSSSAVDPAADTAVADEAAVWWPHPKGYAMVLPTGWTGVVVESSDTAQIVAAVSATMPGLGQRITDVLADSGAEISAIAADTGATTDVAPIMVVLAQPKDGRRPHAIKTEVRDLIRGLPGLSSPLSAHDVVLSRAEGVRFDYNLDDLDAGEVRVYSYLFTLGYTVYLVNFAAPAAMADEAEPIFDAIADSLIFGV